MGYLPNVEQTDFLSDRRVDHASLATSGISQMRKSLEPILRPIQNLAAP